MHFRQSTQKQIWLIIVSVIVSLCYALVLASIQSSYVCKNHLDCHFWGSNLGILAPYLLGSLFFTLFLTVFYVERTRTLLFFFILSIIFLPIVTVWGFNSYLISDANGLIRKSYYPKLIKPEENFYFRWQDISGVKLDFHQNYNSIGIECISKLTIMSANGKEAQIVGTGEYLIHLFNYLVDVQHKQVIGNISGWCFGKK